MLALDKILRDGRTSISEMYNELKTFINDANPINIADNNDDTNITTDTNVITSTSIIDTNITNDESNINTDNDINTTSSIIDTSITTDDINITTDTNINTSTSIIDTSNTVDAYLLTFEDIGTEQNAIDDKIDDINVKSSNNDSISGNNLIIQRLRLLLKVCSFYYC